MFLRYALIAGGTWKWYILIADIKELEKMDASESYPQRNNAKEVLIPQKGEEFAVDQEHQCTWWVNEV